MAVQQLSKAARAKNSGGDVAGYSKKHNFVLPDGWPMGPDGKALTHAWRLIDNDRGNELKQPTGPKTRQHLLQANTVHPSIWPIMR